MNNKTELQTELKELQSSIDQAADRAKEIEKLLTEPEPKPVKWKAPVGEFIILGRGIIDDFKWNIYEYAAFGMSYGTREQAIKARDMMKRMHIMIAYKMAHCPDDEPDWNDSQQRKYFPFYSHIKKVWILDWVFEYQNPCAVYFTDSEICQDLVDKLKANLIEGVEL